MTTTNANPSSNLFVQQQHHRQNHQHSFPHLLDVTLSSFSDKHETHIVSEQLYAEKRDKSHVLTRIKSIFRLVGHE